MNTLSASLTRYRVLAYVVGTWLLVLVLVAMPIKYAAGNGKLVAIVGPIHGFLFIVYLLATADLARRCRWSIVRMGLVMLAGTVPFMSFVAERRVTHDVRARLVDLPRAAVSSPTVSPS